MPGRGPRVACPAGERVEPSRRTPWARPHPAQRRAVPPRLSASASACLQGPEPRWRSAGSTKLAPPRHRPFRRAARTHDAQARFLRDQTCPLSHRPSVRFSAHALTRHRANPRVHRTRDRWGTLAVFRIIPFVLGPRPARTRLGRSGVTGVDVSEGGAFRVIELGRHDVVGAVRVGRVREESHLDAVLAKRSVALRAGRWGHRFVSHVWRIDNAVSPLEPDSWRRLSRGKADANVEATLHQCRLPCRLVERAGRPHRPWGQGLASRPRDVAPTPSDGVVRSACRSVATATPAPKVQRSSPSLARSTAAHQPPLELIELPIDEGCCLDPLRPRALSNYGPGLARFARLLRQAASR